MRERRAAYRLLMRIPEGKRPLGRSRRRWEIMLKRIFRKGAEEAWTGLIWLRIGAGG
jgi:hypothetical protein